MPIIINLTAVNANWKEVWQNALKRNGTLAYFTSVLRFDTTKKLILFSISAILH
jgi:hypothetical protein